ncbi:MAG: Hpt domain-containing protein [Gammaproteobacteria bacterium]|nr:Hpt domain-containing protein [Gammaproteobacteria bacterium]
MSQPDNNIEILLHSLRTAFLEEVPDRCATMEESILALESQVTFLQAFDELYRNTHNLKGGGGTHGIPIITSISHQFEDMLCELDISKECVDGSQIDLMLKYNDLLKNTALDILNGDFVGEQTQAELEALREKSHASEYSCMLVEQSNLLTSIISKEFSHLPVKLTTINNGLVALERLLQENFDYLITSKELPVLNGVALISALRNSDSKNAHIPCVITTSDTKTGNLKQLTDVSIVKKDQLLSKNIVEAINKLIN